MSSTLHVGSRWHGANAPLRSSVMSAVSILLISECVYLLGAVAQGWLHDRWEFSFAFAGPNASYYADIATSGYDSIRDGQSNVAFPPGYPLAAAAISRLTGLPISSSLPLASHLAFAAFLVLFVDYCRQRLPEENSAALAENCGGLLPVVLCAVCPCGTCFRMSCSESLFALWVMLCLWLIQRKCSVTLVALAAGAAGITRVVGVVLVPVAAGYAWTYARHGSLGRQVLVTGAAAVLGAWGTIVFALYCAGHFGNPLEFVAAQSSYNRRPPVDSATKCLLLLTGEPIWSIYVPGSTSYWAIRERSLTDLVICLTAPFYFLCAVGVLAFAAWRRWLTFFEIATGFGLALVPYCTRGYEYAMSNHGRFVSVVIPCYIAAAAVLRACGPAWTLIVLLLCSGLLAFTAGHTL